MSEHITPAPLTKGTRGGVRRGAGKPVGALTGTSTKAPTGKERTSLGRIREELEISDEFANATPLEILMMSMRHFATKGEWMVAAGIAEKAAKYIHAPVSAKQGSVTGDDAEEVTAVSDLPKRRPGRPPIALAA
jgi:hypothetical protein